MPKQTKEEAWSHTGTFVLDKITTWWAISLQQEQKECMSVMFSSDKTKNAYDIRPLDYFQDSSGWAWGYTF